MAIVPGVYIYIYIYTTYNMRNNRKYQILLTKIIRILIIMKTECGSVHRDNLT